MTKKEKFENILPKYLEQYERVTGDEFDGKISYKRGLVLFNKYGHNRLVTLDEFVAALETLSERPSKPPRSKQMEADIELLENRYKAMKEELEALSLEIGEKKRSLIKYKAGSTK